MGEYELIDSTGVDDDIELFEPQNYGCALVSGKDRAF